MEIIKWRVWIHSVILTSASPGVNMSSGLSLQQPSGKKLPAFNVPSTLGKTERTEIHSSRDPMFHDWARTVLAEVASSLQQHSVALYPPPNRSGQDAHSKVFSISRLYCQRTGS